MFKDYISKKTFFGFRLIPKEEYDELQEGVEKRAGLFVEKEKLRGAVLQLKDELSKTQSELKSLKKIADIIDIFLGDPAPIDTEKRRMYVAQVAGLHKDILEPKLKHMISRTMHLLSETTNDRDADIALKGTVYALREILRWGESMVNEQIAYQTAGK